MIETSASEDSEQSKSKSQLKREMLALQNLGTRLTRLQAPVLARLELPDQLYAALQEYARLRSHGAKRRQLQYIGVLMRQVDSARIAQQLQALEHAAPRTRRSLQTEVWRDKLLSGDAAALGEFFACCPDIDRQRLRSLVRAAQQEAEEGSGKAAGRTLFRYLAEVLPE